MWSSILKTMGFKFTTSTENPFTWVYGGGRSLISLSLLSSLLFTDVYLMFDKDILKSIGSSQFIYNRVNLFAWIGYDNLLISKLLVLTILVLVISGIYPRITGVLHFWVVHSFHNACLFLDGGDQIGTILTALLVPITLLDSRKNHWAKPREVNYYTKFLGRLFFSVIALQIAFIYFHTAVEKIYKLDQWTEGTALYYIFNGNYFGLNDFFIGLLNPIITTKAVFFITWWVLLSHMVLAFALFIKRRDKKIFFTVGLIMHLGIAVLMGLYSFSLVMIGGLMIYLLPFNTKLWKNKYM